MISRLSFEAPLGVRLWASSQLPKDDVSRWVMELSAEGENEAEAKFKLYALAVAITAALDEVRER